LRCFPQELAWDYLERGLERDGNFAPGPTQAPLVHAAVYALGTRKRRELVSRIIGEENIDRGWHEIAGIFIGEVAYGMISSAVQRSWLCP
jgi:hypothetical protein